MRNSKIFLAGLLGALTAFIVVALNYLAFRWAGLPRISFSLFDWLARVMPGSIITLMIDSMVTVITRLNLGPTATVAKQIEQALAVILFLFIGFLFGIALAFTARWRPANLVLFGLLGGLILAIPLIFIIRSLGFPPAGPVFSTSWILLVNIAWGWVLAKLIQSVLLPEASAPERKERRQFLTLFGLGSVTILVTAAGISLLEEEEQVPVSGDDIPRQPAVDASTTSGPAQSPPPSELNARTRNVCRPGCAVHS